MADAVRNVTYNLQVVYDEQQGRAALDAFKRTQGEVEKLKRQEADAEKKAADDAEKQAKKAADAEVKQQQRVFQNRMKLLAQIADKRKKDEAAALAQHQAAVGQMQASQDKFRTSVLATSDAVLRVGRGLALLGASGQDNLKKMLDALVKIQAAFDIAKGGVELYYNISEAVKAYRQSVLAAAAAEEALGAARARSAAGGAAVSRGAGAAATGAVGAGVAGGAAAGVAGGAAIAGAIVGVGAAAVAVSDALRGTSTEAGSFSRAIYDFEDGLIAAAAGLFGFKTSLNQMIDSEKELALSNERVNNVTNENLRIQQEIARFRSVRMIESAGESFGRLTDLSSRRASFMGNAASGNNAALIATANRINDVNAQRRLAQGGNTSVDEVMALNREAESLAERQIRLTEERVTLERAAAKEKQDAARASIAAAESELRAAQDTLRVEKERQMSVLERFGQLSTIEQRQLLAVRSRADVVGAEGLSRQERQQLRSIGTSSAERLAREGDIAAARRAGGGGLFRSEDFAAESAARERVRQASVTIQDQRRIEVQVEADMQNVTDEVTRIFEVQYRNLERLIANNIREAAEREATLFQARQTEMQAARMQSVK